MTSTGEDINERIQRTSFKNLRPSVKSVAGFTVKSVDGLTGVLKEIEKLGAMTTKTENSPLRFVVLFHEFPAGHPRDSHWDLMLEHDGELLTWSLTDRLEPGKSISATRLPRHRIDYLHYEGPISDNRGSVSRVLEGTYSWIPNSEHQVAILTIDSRKWEVQFQPTSDMQHLITVSAW